MQITDLVGDPDARAQTAQAIQDFADWTGHEALCIDTVELHPALSDRHGELAGRYSRLTDTISVVVTDGTPQQTPVFHELCHALDRNVLHTLDLALFDGSHPDIDPKRYRSISKQRREHFALLCEQGPPDVDALLALDDTCGPPQHATDETRYLRSVVFPNAPTLPVEAVVPDTRRVELAWQRRPEQQSISATLHGDQFTLLSSETDGNTYLLYVESYDVNTGARVHDAALARSSPGRWSWLDGPGPPILIDRLHPTSAYQWSPSSGELEALDVPGPPPLSYVEGGFTTPEAAYIIGDGGVWWTQLNAPAPWRRTHTEQTITGFIPTLDGALLLTEDGGLRLEDGHWVHADPPADEHDVLAGLSEGRWLSLVRVSALDGVDLLYPGILRADRSTSLLALCDHDLLTEEIVVYVWDEERFGWLSADGRLSVMETRTP